MEVILNIKRQVSKRKKPYYQKFVVSALKDNTIMQVIQLLNRRNTLTDAYGNEVAHIACENDCMDGKCGKCAITVNGIEMIACKTRLSDLCKRDGEMLIIEPARGMKVIQDLMVQKDEVIKPMTQSDVLAAKNSLEGLGADDRNGKIVAQAANY